MAQTALAYTARKFRPDDEAAVLDLLKLSLGESPVLQRTPDLWRWKHPNNHFGPSYVRVAGGEAGLLVGMRAFMRWEFEIEGRPVRAVRAVDTATHPDYRRLGIFAALTHQVVEEAREDGVDLIFNTPNRYSLPGYLKMGWHLVASVQPMVRVLNYPRFVFGLARHGLTRYGLGRYGSMLQSQPPGRDRTEFLKEFFKEEPAPVATLLERPDAVRQLLIGQGGGADGTPGGIGTRRSWDYLRWRYADHPTIPYWTVVIEDGSGILGCAIYRTNVRFGLREAVLCELLLSQTGRGVGRELLRRLRATLDADYLIGHFSQGSYQHRLLKEGGFRAISRRGIDFAVRPLGGDLPRDPLQFNNWSLSMGDLELF
jgi:GNAT superfamily N-acetyltransferase